MASRLKRWRERQKKVQQFVDEIGISSDDNQYFAQIEWESNSVSAENEVKSPITDNEVIHMQSTSEEEGHVAGSSGSDAGGSLNEESEEEPQILSQSLAKCALDNGWTHQSVDQLLLILRNHGHGDLPKTARTLLKTPRVIQVENKCGGDYVYVGLAKNLQRILLENPQDNLNIELLFNIDGLPLHRSSPKSVWSILCVMDESEVFVVGLYYGKKKLDPVGDYLQDFLDEWRVLKNDGLKVHDKLYNFAIKAFMCDAPARAFLKGTIYHTGYYSCERCTIKGTYEGRVVFNDFEAELVMRSEKIFNEYGYSNHQRSISPLVDAGISCIHGFVLDYMHLVMLGVVKRLLKALLQSSFGSKARLSANQKGLLASSMVSLKGCLPSEFSRQPRSIDELDYWKATEFRQFLLYIGPVVLRELLPSQTYDHFMYLSVSISILLNFDAEFRQANLMFVKDVLSCFVSNCEAIYGRSFCVYNVHGLLHLHEDVSFHQCSLNEISCFPFENYLQRIKRSVRSGHSPLVQICKRQSEMFQYKLASKKRFTKISTTDKDGWFFNGKDVMFVREKRGDQYACDVFKQNQLHDVFTMPSSSKVFNIFLRCNNTRPHSQRLFKREDFKTKVVCIQDRRGKCLFPLLHDIERV